MIEIIVGTVVYTASLIGCYDGDTCKIKLDNTPDLVAEVTLRFEGFDTPEIRGKCVEEKVMAREAKNITLAYMGANGTLYSEGKKGKYGRLLVEAPELKRILIDQGVARHYDGGKRESWCD